MIKNKIQKPITKKFGYCYLVFGFCLSLSVCANSANAATASQSLVIQPRRVTGVADYRPKENVFASALVLDAKTKKVLFSFKPTKAWPAASLTKLTGAMVFLDQGFDWNKIVAIKKQDEVGGGRLRVSSGATMSIKDVVYSSLIGSANNAATALARISGLGMKNFVTAMNSKAKALGCINTVFYDASGMNENNMTSVSDVAKIALAAFSKSELRQPAATASYTFKVRNTGELHTIKNTNGLLIDENNGLYVTGGKTGYLEESKNNLVVRLRPSQKDVNRELLVVVFGAETKTSLFDVAANLARWSWSAYDWSTPTVAKAYGN